MSDIIPENFGENRALLPTKITGLVGYYHKDKFDWVIKNNLYNARTGDTRGSLRLSPKKTVQHICYYTEKIKVEEEFSNYQWDITQLAAYTHYRGSGLPFAVSLAELMEVKV